MIHSLLSPVHIISEPNLDAALLLKIIRFTTGIGERNLKITIVHDTFPMEARTTLITGLYANASVLELTDVSPNPQTQDITNMMSSLVNQDTDVVLGIGGGSVLDSAKAVSMLATNGGKLDEYLGPMATRKIEKKGLPLILIPTTAGTGSEVTKVGVYTSEEGRKFTLGSPFLLADAAVLCGKLTNSMPPSLTAATGFDALDHALESIWNKNATPITKMAAVDAAVAVLEVLDDAYDASLRIHQPQEGDNAVRQKMLEAACIAGVAFSITGTAAGHALSFILSEEWHIPHGSACAFTIEDIYRLALLEPKTTSELAKIASHFYPEIKDEKDLCQLLLEKIITIKKRMHLSETFSELGITLGKEDIPRYFDRAFTDPKMLNQLPPLSPSLIYPLLEAKR